MEQMRESTRDENGLSLVSDSLSPKARKAVVICADTGTVRTFCDHPQHLGF